MGLLSRSRARSIRVQPEPSEPVGVHIVGPNSIDILRARDISESGLGVQVPHRFEGCDIHAEVELVITLPQHKAFVAKGVVRHRTESDDSPSFGVEFTDISKRHRKLLRSYVSDRLAA